MLMYLALLPMSIACASNFFNDSLPSVVTLEIGTDAIESRDTILFLDYGLQTGNRIQVSYGSTSNDVQISDENSYSIGFTGDPLNELNFGFSYEFQERDEELFVEAILLYGRLVFINDFVKLHKKQDAVSAMIRWQPGDWSLTLKPQIRNILLTPANSDQNRGIRSPGYDFSIVFYGIEQFSFLLDRADYDYSNNVDLLREIAKVSGGYFDSRTTAALDYSFNQWLIGLEWQRNVAIESIDKYKTVVLSLALALNDDWSVQGRIGRPTGGSINTEGFGSLALSYSW